MPDEEFQANYAIANKHIANNKQYGTINWLTLSDAVCVYLILSRGEIERDSLINFPLESVFALCAPLHWIVQKKNRNIRCIYTIHIAFNLFTLIWLLSAADKQKCTHKKCEMEKKGGREKLWSWSTNLFFCFCVVSFSSSRLQRKEQTHGNKLISRQCTVFRENMLRQNY